MQQHLWNFATASIASFEIDIQRRIQSLGQISINLLVLNMVRRLAGHRFSWISRIKD